MYRTTEPYRKFTEDSIFIYTLKHASDICFSVDTVGLLLPLTLMILLVRLEESNYGECHDFFSIPPIACLSVA